MQCRVLACLVTAVLLLPLAAAQALVYDEAVNGELAFQSGSPPQVTVALEPGVNTISGTLSKTLDATDADPFFAVVPDGLQIESIQYDYSTSFTVPSGVAYYFFYIDQNGSGLTSEFVDVVTTPSGSRAFYESVMPLGPATYTIGRQGSGINNDAVYTVTYTYTITVSGDAPPPPEISVDATEFCVDDEFFYFDVTVTGDSGELSLQIGADADPATTPVQRIAADFNAATGAFSDGEPIAETYGTPPAARWLDGAPESYELVSAGGTSWRLSGRVRHGADRFVAGDSLWGVRLTESPTTEATGALPIAACPEPPPPPAAVSVPFVRVEPTLDGKIGYNEWRTSPQIQLTNGSITMVHDEARLYLLINMRGDRTDNAFRDGGPDQFWLLFDVDEDGAVTPNLDRRYRMLSGTGNFRYETYAGPGGPPLNPPEDLSFSALGEGFGCFLADRSFRLVPTISCDNHRVWEIAIDLLEIRASADKSARLGLLVQSELDVLETRPQDLTAFAEFLALTLEGKTNSDFLTLPLNPVQRAEFRVTQGAQDAANSLALVAGRDTYLALNFESDLSRTEAVTASVFMSQGGVDLPGSPFTYYGNLGWSGELPYRVSPAVPIDGAFTTGDLDVRMIVRQPIVSSTTAGPTQTISFVRTRTPTYWIVPVKNANGAGPGAKFLERSELDVRAAFPIADVNFVRRPAISASPATDDAAIDVMNRYDQQAVLAWTFGLLLTGESPFELPDQVIGAFPSDAPFGSVIGMADPRWFEGGAGRVLFIKQTTAENGFLLPHEINHNLDLDIDGTWGRHAPGCGTDGQDPQWPYASWKIENQDLVTETILGKDDFTLTPVIRVDAETPDYMSYCRASFSVLAEPRSAYPYQWISTYRWRRQLENVFAVPTLNLAAQSVAAMAAPGDAFYVTGRVNADGSGALDPVLLQPGLPRADQRPGAYEVRLAGCDGSVRAAKSFGARFVNVEGQPRASVPFSMILGDPGGVCAVELRSDGALLAERTLSASPPEVTLLAPNGGESWDGPQTVRWSTTDPDGDQPLALLQFSADGGQTWLPVARDLAGGEYLLDTATLPGTDLGLLRIVVTDGLRVAEDQSDGVFSIAQKPPVVEIIAPDGAENLFAGETLRFQGSARDPQGNPLPADDFVWLIDGAPIALGNPAQAVLEPGATSLTLRVSAPNGLTGEANLALVVFAADSDRDGFPDDQDQCALSESSPTVVIETCDSGVPDRVLSDGCTLADQTIRSLAQAGREGTIEFLKSLWRDGTLAKGEEKAIRKCLPPDEDDDAALALN